jgi:hypothetical protein
MLWEGSVTPMEAIPARPLRLDSPTLSPTPSVELDPLDSTALGSPLASELRDSVRSSQFWPPVRRSSSVPFRIPSPGDPNPCRRCHRSDSAPQNHELHGSRHDISLTVARDASASQWYALPFRLNPRLAPHLSSRYRFRTTRRPDLPSFSIRRGMRKRSAGKEDLPGIGFEDWRPIGRRKGMEREPPLLQTSGQLLLLAPAPGGIQAEMRHLLKRADRLLPSLVMVSECAFSDVVRVGLFIAMPPAPASPGARGRLSFISLDTGTPPVCPIESVLATRPQGSRPPDRGRTYHLLDLRPLQQAMNTEIRGQELARPYSRCTRSLPRPESCPRPARPSRVPPRRATTRSCALALGVIPRSRTNVNILAFSSTTPASMRSSIQHFPLRRGRSGRPSVGQPISGSSCYQDAGGFLVCAPVTPR